MSFDLAAVKALAAEKQVTVGPCNRRCAECGECAFGRAETPGSFCRHKPRRRRPAPDGRTAVVRAP